MYVFLFCGKVISGHTGWVRSVTVEPGNQWFATGSADRTIKVNYCFDSAYILIVESTGMTVSKKY